MSLFNLLLVSAVILLAVAGLTSTVVWIFWVALALAAGAAVVAITNNDRSVR
jgi:ABC-type uncharacterized transport system involved in gliding motility auxiliary subunit